MARFSSRYLFFSTSPRNPRLIPGIISIIKKNGLEGKEYNKKLQAAFYTLYAKSEVGVQGANGSKDPALSGRDKLTRAPQALGFIQVRSGKPLKVSAAGNLLLNQQLFEDVLLHQILKFQLPSPLHTETQQNKGYFCIKPFLEILRLVNDLGYLTYQELKIFGMSLTDYRAYDNTVLSIKKFREERAALKGKMSLKQFAADTEWKVYIEKYSDIIDSNQFNTRESKTNDLKSFMKKKLSNLSDYTDAIFRALRETGLLVMSKGKSISISPKRKDEVNYILESVSREPLPITTKRDDFDNYMYDATIPALLSDNKAVLRTQLTTSDEPYSETDDIYALKSKVLSMRIKQRQNQVDLQAERLKQRNSDDIDDIIDMYNKIKNREVVDGPMMMEWNTWRAMTMIDHGSIKGNFVPDDNGMPISTAGGNQGDILGDYGDFNIVIEVTISSGKRQYDMEGEPVTRHVGELQTSSGKTTFGLFIAVVLADSVVNHFYTTALLNSKVYGGKVDVIPLGLDDFIRFFKNAATKVLTERDLLSIHTHSSNSAKQVMLDDKTEVDWHNEVLDYMNSLTI